MLNFFAEHWAEIVLSLISAGALAGCKYAFGELKNYKNLLEQQDEHEIVRLIKEELKPISENLEILNNKIVAIEKVHEFQLTAIVDSYKYRLIQLCKIYLEQGYMTSNQFEQLSELHKLYNKLGGNNQGDEYYEKAKRLPVRDE